VVYRSPGATPPPDAELEKLLIRVWLIVGHESQVPNPGDFFVSHMGEA